ncbi:hypothetical protein [Streptomyces peucetius]|uniref:OvmZ protein n=1 Tax=Streptomyces peucetius TaxID=1950 RepID=A0ABY6I6K9_STRPE|nr:hypothetical protein [Streptomyces peucetius]UYQ62637.1 hypothetical protein OGH68_14860 [Streptomyces peucetius]
MADRIPSQCTSTRCRRAAQEGGLPSRRAEPGARLCGSCLRAFLRDLAALPALHRESEQYLTPAEGGLAPRVTGSRENTLPVSTKAVDSRHDAVARLSSWARLVAEERPSTTPPRRTVTAMTAFLTGHKDWLVAHPAAGRMADEIAAAAAGLRDLDVRRSADLVPLGACVEPGCEAQVSLPRRGGDDLVLRGPVCGAGHVLTPRQWLAMKEAA